MRSFGAAMKSARFLTCPALANARSSRPNNSCPASLAAILTIAIFGFATVAYAYWPGVMIDDARWQYQQSADNAYEDWHPPLMAWVWHHLMPVAPGPAPMLVLQLSLYWAGIAMIAVWLYRRGSPVLGVLAACAGWLPASLALMGSVTKDSLMTGTLGCTVGLLLWGRTARAESSRWALGAATIFALLLAAALRANAFLACVPLALAVLPRTFVSTRPRFALAALTSAAIFFVAPGAVARALHADDTDSQLSLIIFDLGGITEHTGLNQFPDLHVANPVAVNRRCYDPFQWDSYSTWARRPCPLGFERFQSLVDEGDTDPRMIWLHAIASHPIAYAQHRLAHFNLSTWFIVPDNPDPPAWKQSVPNPWNFQVMQNPVLEAVDSVANAAAKTPLGWPISWIAIALAVVIICRSAKLDRVVTAVAASAFVYGAGYLIFGVATGMRYYVWTMTGAALAAVLAVSELSRRRSSLDRRSALLAAATVLLPTTLAVLARLAA